MIGNSQKNKWCCFCKYWFDPSCSAIKPLAGKDMFQVEMSVKCKCSKRNMTMQAVASCKEFTKKM